ncbi:MAG: hypothetical protein JWM96_1410 [Alphaproteobacteria bacterium]|nr:hypothetical protein [Alphaproteobacteria bacterium]
MEGDSPTRPGYDDAVEHAELGYPATLAALAAGELPETIEQRLRRLRPRAACCRSHRTPRGARKLNQCYAGRLLYSAAPLILCFNALAVSWPALTDS